MVTPGDRSYYNLKSSIDKWDFGAPKRILQLYESEIKCTKYDLKQRVAPIKVI